MFETKRAELGSAYYRDAEHHLLADDIIYFGSQLYKSDYWPSLAEYDPEISAEQWLGLLTDRTICTAENLAILKTIQQVGGEATCKQLSLKLTHVDFLLFRRMDKSPLLAIEVDGVAFHAAGSLQASRDEKKNRIFERCGMPLLRLRTDGSGEKERIEQALLAAVSNNG